MGKINNNYTHQDVQALYNVLEQMVSIGCKKFDADCKLANEINNSEGVGIQFDFYTPAPLPAWMTAARIAMKAFHP